MSAANEIKFHLVPRDYIQCAVTVKNVSAADYIAAAASDLRFDTQTMGGTFNVAENARAGRFYHEVAAEVGKACEGSHQTALYRGHHGLGTDKVLSRTMHEYLLGVMAENGVKEIQNFNGMNDIDMMKDIPAIAKKLGMKARGTIYIQSESFTAAEMPQLIEQHLKFAQELVDSGHEGFYIKSANGKVDPDYTYTLIRALKEKFPDQHIAVHIHDTYGQAAVNYLAATKAGADRLDLLKPEMAGGSGHLSIENFLFFAAHSEDPEIIDRLPKNLDWKSPEAVRDATYDARGRYGYEMRYDPEMLKSHESASSAGGSITVIINSDVGKSMMDALKTTDQERVQRVMNLVKAEIVRPALGFPPNVTPYEYMQDLMTAFAINELISQKERHSDKAVQGMSLEEFFPYAIAAHKDPTSAVKFDPFKKIPPNAMSYLVGEWGKVSERVDPDLQQRALVRRELTAPVKPDGIDDVPNELEIAKAFLERNGFENPSIHEQALRAMLFGMWMDNDPAKKLITARRAERDISVKAPDYPEALREGTPLGHIRPQIFEAAFMALEIQKLKDGFFVGIPPELAAKRAAQLQQDLRELTNTRMLNTLVDAGITGISLGRALNQFKDEFAKITKRLGVREENAQISFDLTPLKKEKTRPDLLESLGLVDKRTLRFAKKEMHSAHGFTRFLWAKFTESVERNVRRNGILAIGMLTDVLNNHANGGANRNTLPAQQQAEEDPPQPQQR